MADFKGTIGTVPEELRGSLSSDLPLSGRLSSLGIPGNGIASIEKTSTDGLTDTYTITYDDGATTTYQITNGNGIFGAVFNDDNTLTLSFDDGTELTTGVLRGDNGEKVLLKAENNVVSYKYESDPNWTTLVDLTGFADDASNAADRATAKAEEARQSAIRAENSASDANASAGIATTKAEEAASSEEQAGISMRRAETAASDALVSKNLAQEAAATATTAQDNARIYSERTLGYANNAAQSAQSAGNSAASAAQSATGLSEAVASAQQSARNAATSATQAQEYYDGIDEVAVQAMEDYLDAHPAVQSVNGKTRHVVLNAEDVGALPEDTFIPSKITDLTNDSDFATNGDLAELQTKLNTLADSDDQTLDQLSEIVAYIKNNKSLIDGITTGKVSVSDIVDNLTSTATNKPLSAKQGKVLKDLIDAIVIPTKVSAFTNDAGYLTEHQDISGKQDVISDLATIRSGAALGATALQVETDPTVPAWAKAQTKPSYTAAEVGALPSDTTIPTKVSELTNDSGYLTEHQDISGKANIADLATVATSGNYNDLSNKPTIPTKVSDLTDDSGHYTKPSGGIPASDLADGVISDLPVSRGTGAQSLIIGDTTNNIASHMFSYAEGNRTTASGYNSHAEGGGTTASGSQSHAEGAGTTASKENAHSEGIQTTASGSNSHAEGANTTASGGQSHSEGLQTTAYGFQSHAEGWGTIAGSAHQHVQGKFNVADSNDVYAHIVGGGSSTSNRKNIQTLDWSGNEAIAGNLTLGKDSADEIELTAGAVKSLITTTALPASADLNSYTTPGNYTADSTVIASITHAPTTTVEYKLTVEQISDEVIKQTVTTTEAPANVYQRTGDSSSTDWVFGDWVKEIKSTDYASTTNAGIVLVDSANGIGIESQHKLYIEYAPSNLIKSGIGNYRPITPQRQHEAVFYGLAKASGDMTQALSDNAVGTYTNEAKTAIRSMLGTIGDVQVNNTSIVTNGIANIPYASTTTHGVVKINTTYGLNVAGEYIAIQPASNENIKAGISVWRPVVAEKQHQAVFYGLAKAAGDTTQAISSNAIGTYTQEAKTAIKSMLDITTPEAVGSCVEYISDSSVTIVGEPNTRYVCGEVTSIDITPPAVGTIDVTFTSGSTIAILTLPSTVKMPEWWGGVETGYTYELVITDGTYAGVMAWPQ